MKLLVCTTEYFPNGAGIANVAYSVVNQLKEMGVECTVCSPTGPDIKLGSQVLIQKTGIGGLLNYWYQVSRYFKDDDYDVVWLHNPFIFTGNPFKRCMVTMHTTYYGSSTNGVGSLLFHLYKSLVAHIESYCLIRMSPNTLFTAVGKPVCKELEKIGIERDRILYIPNGVDTGRFHLSPKKKLLRKKFGILENNIVLLSIGRLTHQKQPHILIEVFSHLERELGDVTLCIAGKGELLEKTKDLAEKMGLCKVLFLGYVDDRDLPDLYACSDYYIMTSKYEGLPLTLLEAMASGLSCIVSDIPNLGIVEDAKCGIVIDFHNIEIAAGKIIIYMKENDLDHSKNARDYAVKNLGWRIIAKMYLEEFEKL